MDGAHFDALTRRLRSRRDALAAVGAFGAALGVARRAAAGTPPPCVPTGAKCDPKNAAACCTGSCKKHKGKFRCAAVGAALGCKKKFDACVGKISACPDDPTGLCVNDNKGKPLCIEGGTGFGGCVPCASDADCTDVFGSTARCIRHCASCETKSGGSACVVPAPVA